MHIELLYMLTNQTKAKGKKIPVSRLSIYILSISDMSFKLDFTLICFHITLFTYRTAKLLRLLDGFSADLFPSFLGEILFYVPI